MSQPYNFERNANTKPLMGLGDPERWGGYSRIVVPVKAGGGTFEVKGAQFVRVQTQDMMARCWVVSATFEASGIVDGVDAPEYHLEMAYGVGAGTGIARIDLEAVARLNPYFVPRVNAALKVLSWACVMPAPVPAIAIAVVPVARVVAAAGADHDVTFSFSAFVAPWSLA